MLAYTEFFFSDEFAYEGYEWKMILIETLLMWRQMSLHHLVTINNLVEKL